MCQARKPDAAENVDMLVAVHMRERAGVQSILGATLKLPGNLLFHVAAHLRREEGQSPNQFFPIGDNPAIAKPRLADKRNVQSNAHAIALQLPQLFPIEGSTLWRKGDALHPPFFDAIENAAVDVRMKPQIVGVYEQDGWN
jgi:hypothetical protein